MSGEGEGAVGAADTTGAASGNADSAGVTQIRRVGHQRERDERFKAWIQQQPEWRCLITLAEHPEPAHLRSKGAGGSDYWLLPLCFDEHRQSHDKPEWWYRHRIAVAEWIAFLPTLWERYEQEHADA